MFHTNDNTWNEVSSLVYVGESEQHMPSSQTDSTLGKTCKERYIYKTVNEGQHLL